MNSINENLFRVWRVWIPFQPIMLELGTILDQLWLEFRELSRPIMNRVGQLSRPIMNRVGNHSRPIMNRYLTIFSTDHESSWTTFSTNYGWVGHYSRPIMNRVGQLSRPIMVKLNNFLDQLWLSWTTFSTNYG